jgi:electron transfer flavoprotein alpha subunit
MAVLVFAEHTTPPSRMRYRQDVAAAQAFGGDIDVLVAGHNAGGAAAAAAKIAGVRKVIHVEGEAFSHALAEAVEALVVPLMAGYDAVLRARHHHGQERRPAHRRQARRDAGLGNHESVDTSTFERPIYAGNAIMTVKSSDAKKVITVRGTAFQAVAAKGFGFG